MKKKTNVAEARNKIKQMFQAEMIKELKNLYISNDNNGIKAFGRFRIRNQKDTGLFTVAEEHWDTSPEFMTARNAMAFSVFQHNKHSDSAKEVYNLIIAGSDTKNKSIIKYNLSRFIADTNRLTREILKLQYGLDPTYNLDIYDFKIIETLRVEGFNYSQILKIIFINLVVSIFGIFIFHIRKSINLI